VILQPPIFERTLDNCTQVITRHHIAPRHWV